MPFVNRHKEKESGISPDRQALFIGRSEELRYFSENILKPRRPDRNIISIYGQGGVGKSTLVQHMINEAEREEFQHYCCTARVNERQPGLTEIMEQLAEQLDITGDFVSALTKYKDALRKLQQDYENSLEKGVKDLSSKFTGDLASKIPIPIVNDIVKQGTTDIVNGLWDGWHYRQQMKEARRLENPIKDLTQAFVKELNKQAMIEVTLPDRQRRYQRLLLFFDTYEQLASYVGQWLLDQVLTEDIEMDIVFILVGREPVTRSQTDDPKKWLDYEADCHFISLEPFSEEESNVYLSQRGITDPEQRATIWQLSRGLPLYLSLLTTNPNEKVDPTADVVANFLRWIAADEQIKRQLILDMSLHSRPFSQDDLSVCPYVPTEQRLSLFNWLITQPFIQGYGLNGRYSYHDIVRGHFRRYLYSRSPQQYEGTRQHIADYYRQERQKLVASTEEEDTTKIQWQELSLALIEQLLLLPEREKHAEAIGIVVQAQNQASRDEIARVLQAIVTEQRTCMLQNTLNKVVSTLIEYNKKAEDDQGQKKKYTDQEKKFFLKERRKVLNTLLKYMEEAKSNNTKAMARLYFERGTLSTQVLNGTADALADIDKALELEPRQSDFHFVRGMVLISNNRLQDALEAFDHMLSFLSDDNADMYFQVGQILDFMSHEEEALLYFDKALILDGTNAGYLLMKSQTLLQLKQYAEALKIIENISVLQKKELEAFYIIRGQISVGLNRFDEALEDFDQAIQNNNNQWVPYLLKSQTYEQQQQYLEALEILEQAWTRYPELSTSEAYYQFKGRILSHLKRYEEALSSFNKLLEMRKENSGAHINKGNMLLELQRYDEALLTFNTAILLDPNNSNAYRGKSLTLLHLKRPEEGLEILDQAIRKNPDEVRLHMIKGEILLSIERYIGALDAFEKALRLDPNNDEAYVGKGEVYSHRKQHNDALIAFEKALEFNDKNRDAHFKSGLILSDLQRYEEALTAFESALRLDPTKTGAYVNKGATLYHLQRYEEALISLEEALRLDPTDASAYVNKGATLSSLQRYEEALISLEEALRLDPTKASAYINKGTTLNHLQRYEEALISLEETLRLDSTKADAYMTKGTTLSSLQRYEEALISLEEALRLDLTDADIYVSKGAVLYHLQRYEEALISLEEALRLDPTKADAYINKGATLTSLQRYEEALISLEEALRLDPTDASAYMNKGTTLSSLQRYEEALISLEEALCLDPTDASAYINKGTTLNHLQRYEEALISLEEALRLDPTDASAYMNKGATLSHLQRYEEAIDALNQAMQINYYSDLNYYKGCILLKLKHYEEAVKTFIDYFDPQKNGVLDDKTAIFDLQEQYEEALLWVNQEIEKAHENANIYINKGILLLVFCKWEEALATFNQAITLHTEKKNVYTWNGAILLKLECYQEAIILADEMIARDLYDADAMEIKGNAFFALEQYQKTINILEKAITLVSNRASLYAIKGLAWLQLEHYQVAIEDLNQALKLDPEQANWRTKRNEASEKFQQKQMELLREQTIPKGAEQILLEPLKEKLLLLGNAEVSAVLREKLSVPILTNKPTKNLNRYQQRNASKKQRKHR